MSDISQDFESVEMLKYWRTITTLGKRFIAPILTWKNPSLTYLKKMRLHNESLIKMHLGCIIDLQEYKILTTLKV